MSRVWALVDRGCSKSPFLQQTAALTFKNGLVAWRSRRATILHLLAPCIFLLLALIIQASLDANNNRESRVKAADRAEPVGISSIPGCQQDLFYAGRPCVDLLFSPNDSAAVRGIITRIKSNNAPPIPDDKVLGFATRADADAYLLANAEGALGAVHFHESGLPGSAAISYIIQSNSTVKGFRGQYQQPVNFFALPLMNAVAREATRAHLAAAGRVAAAANLDWSPGLLKFPHPQLRSIGRLGYILGPFIFAACMFGVVTQLAAIVGEKEQGLVTALRHMGLLQSSYWTSWILFDLAMGLLTALTIVIFGLMLQFRFFLANDPGLLVLLFFLFSLAMASFSYFLSVFMSRQTTATYTGFAVFLVGWICQTIAIFGLPYNPEYYFAKNNVGKGFFAVFACLPWCPLIKATLDLAAATASDKDPGLRWSERSSYCQYIPDAALQPPHNPLLSFVDFTCIFPLSQVYATLIAQAVCWLVLALYLDNVLRSGSSGVLRPLWFFLLPSYWAKHNPSTARQLRKTDSLASSSSRRSSIGSGDGGGRRSSSSGSGDAGTDAAAVAVPADATSGSKGGGPVAAAGVRVSAELDATPAAAAAAGQEDEDVAAEAEKMRALLKHRVAMMGDTLKASRTAVGPAGQQPHAVPGALLAVRHAVEVFGLSKVFNGHRAGCRGSVGGSFCAIEGSWFGIEEGQLFCLLGPNGAGKSTTIQCLTGLLAASSGDVLVCGESVATEGGVDRIRRRVGVCPQFDVLWGELTGREHLLVAGHVKGIRASQVKAQASELLGRVQLQAAAGVRAGCYSGGMKRRLSVALALTGDPAVLYLDEPTTGMDPISRRHVWDVIQAAKPGRAIVLTTHSMEEADVLGDRIAIMARGRLRAIGSSIRLKHKFGAGYQVVVTLKGAAATNAARQQQQQPAAAAAGAPGASAGTAAELPAQQQQEFDLSTPRSWLAGEQQQPQQPQQPSSGPAVGTGAVGPSPLSAADSRRGIKELIAAHLGGLAPAEEGRQTLRYAVPREQQQQLEGLLRLLEESGVGAKAPPAAAGAGVAGGGVPAAVAAGMSDIQLSLTSLEEVFLNIAKAAELEAAAVSGERVLVQLPDEAGGRQVAVAVGQDWVEEPPGSGRRWRVKWVADEAGRLTVLEVLPAAAGSCGGALAAQQVQQLPPVAG